MPLSSFGEFFLGELRDFGGKSRVIALSLYSTEEEKIIKQTLSINKATRHKAIFHFIGDLFCIASTAARMRIRARTLRDGLKAYYIYRPYA